MHFYNVYPNHQHPILDNNRKTYIHIIVIMKTKIGKKRKEIKQKLLP